MHCSLHLVTSGKQSLVEVVDIVRAAVQGGIDYVQLREKTLSARELMIWADSLAQIIPRHRILINDRLDVALASGSGGVHLAYHSISLAEAKPLLSSGMMLGRSVHSLAEAEDAYRQGATYLYYGHVFESSSKPGLPPRGTDELRQITRLLPVPAIAIGGITPERVREVLEAGCAGVAILSGITDASDPVSATRAYRRAIDEWSQEKGAASNPAP